MVEVASEEQLTQVILPALLARAEDPVPNVKFNVCKVLEVRICPSVWFLLYESLRPACKPPVPCMQRAWKS